MITGFIITICLLFILVGFILTGKTPDNTNPKIGGSSDVTQDTGGSNPPTSGGKPFIPKPKSNK